LGKISNGGLFNFHFVSGLQPGERNDQRGVDGQEDGKHQQPD
jgi:hypothetical protein